MLWLAGLLVFYTVAGFFILPPIIRAVAVKQIASQLDREVSIQQVKLNPYALSISIRGLLVKDKDGEPFLSWDEVYVNFQLSSFFGRAWNFQEISTVKPFVRVQMNADHTFNFSDLLAKFSTNAPESAPKKPAGPLFLHVEKLQIIGATVGVADLSARTPYKRLLGPLDVTLEHFRTDPDNQNPYSFYGTTDTGEQYSWNGHFTIVPLRSDGEIRISRVDLNKYAPLYQDLVRFEIRDGTVELHAHYRFEFSPTNLVASVTNTAFGLRNFKLAEPGNSNDIVNLALFGTTGVSFDLKSRQVEIGSIFAKGGSLSLARNKDNTINVVELSQPEAGLTNAPGGVLLLLHSLTNAVSLLLQSTNQWRGTVHDIDVTNCALHLKDLSEFTRPATLDNGGHRAFQSAKHLQRPPPLNLTAALSMRLEHQRDDQHRSLRLVRAGPRPRSRLRSRIWISARWILISEPKGQPPHPRQQSRPDRCGQVAHTERRAAGSHLPGRRPAR